MNILYALCRWLNLKQITDILFPYFCKIPQKNTKPRKKNVLLILLPPKNWINIFISPFLNLFVEFRPLGPSRLVRRFCFVVSAFIAGITNNDIKNIRIAYLSILFLACFTTMYKNLIPTKKYETQPNKNQRSTE